VRAIGWIVFSPDSKMLAILHSITEVRMVAPATGREYARLPTAGGPYCFSPDGSQLVTYAGRDGDFHVWDLRMIRHQLAAMELDWDLPPYPPPAHSGESKPLRVEVLAGEPLPPSKELDAEAFFERGIFRSSLRHASKAQEDFKRALMLDPQVKSRFDMRDDGSEADAIALVALGQACEELGRLEEAVATYQEVLRLRPKLAQAHDRLSSVAWQFVASSDSNACNPRAIELVKLLIAQDARVEPLAGCAPMLILVDDLRTYRELCDDLVNRHETTAEPRTAYLVARICALAPHGMPDAAKVVQMADRAVRAVAAPHYLHTLGLAHYRAGQFDAAIQQLHKSIDGNWSANAANWLVLAMAHQRLGHAAEAQKWFDRAVDWIDNPSPGLRSLHRHDVLACLVLRREAKTLLDAGPPVVAEDQEEPNKTK
jgi:tetratricopeptide (TPR) repeat protein